uniref:SMC-Scp complex subunit ScpB n=1 Tax=candidate division WOR-3 bacterium TaxID=2052148 RepID=A0A7C4GAJ1_UNCW3
MTPDSAPLPAIVEALLFAADEPLSLKRLSELTGGEENALRTAIDELNSTYAAAGRTFRIHRVAQGFQLYTLPDYADWVRKLYQHTHVIRLSRAALEVLAVIAYRQPITRPEIDKLRGVDCSGPLITLLERSLITTAGRAHRPGNPFLYRTTREFLRYFGLESLDDLPRPEEISTFLAAREARADTDESGTAETAAPPDSPAANPD